MKSSLLNLLLHVWLWSLSLEKRETSWRWEVIETGQYRVLSPLPFYLSVCTMKGQATSDTSSIISLTYHTNILWGFFHSASPNKLSVPLCYKRWLVELISIYVKALFTSVILVLRVCLGTAVGHAKHCVHCSVSMWLISLIGNNCNLWPTTTSL